MVYYVFVANALHQPSRKRNLTMAKQNASTPAVNAEPLNEFGPVVHPAPVEAKDSDLITITLTHTKNCDETLICRSHPTERWFAKKHLKAWAIAVDGEGKPIKGSYSITLPRKALKYRDMLPE